MNMTSDDPNKDLRDTILVWYANNPGKAFPCHGPDHVERVAKAFKDDMRDGVHGSVAWCAGTWWQYDKDWRRIATDDMAIMVQDFWRMVSDMPLTAKGIKDLLDGWRTMPEFALSRSAMSFAGICVQCVGPGDGPASETLCIENKGDWRDATEEDIANRLHRFMVV